MFNVLMLISRGQIDYTLTILCSILRRSVQHKSYKNLVREGFQRNEIQKSQLAVHLAEGGSLKRHAFHLNIYKFYLDFFFFLSSICIDFFGDANTLHLKKYIFIGMTFCQFQTLENNFIFI